MEVGGQCQAWLLYPRERPCTHSIGGLVGLSTGLDWCGKSHPPLGFDIWTIQPVASHYADYQAHTCINKLQKNMFLLTLQMGR